MLRLIVLCLALFVAAPMALGAQPAASETPFSVRAADWTIGLNRARAMLGRPNLTLPEIDAIAAAVEEVRQSAGAVRDEQRQKAESVKGLLAALGPPPEASATPEPPDVAAKRRELDTEVAAITGRAKQAELAVAQADEMAKLVLQARQSQFTETILARGPSPLSPHVWTVAVPELGTAVIRLVAAPIERWQAVGQEGVPTGQRLRDVLLAGAGLFVALAVGWPLRRWLLSRFGRDPAEPAPDFSRRVLAAAAGGTARGLLPSLAIIAVTLALVAGDPSALFAVLVRSLGLAAVIVTLAATLAWAALAPAEPAWRILDVDDLAARLLSRRITLAAGIGSIHVVFFGIAEAIGASEELRALLPGIVDTAFAMVLFSLLPGRLWRDARHAAAAGVDSSLPESDDAAHLSADSGPTPGPTAADGSAEPPLASDATLAPALGGRWWFLTRVAAGIVAASVPLWVMFGYARLGTYLNNVVALSGATIGILLMLRLLAAEAMYALVGHLDGPAEPGVPARPVPTAAAALRRWLALGDPAMRRVEFWLSLLVDLALIAAGLVLLALVLGMRPGDLRDTVADIFTGFSIGKIKLSPVDIGLGLLLFAAVLGATRLVQRFVDERVLRRTRVDMGVRNSLIAGIGYVGFFVAAITGISTAGVDLSNLAIVAGALSVGIGFGLQNIVNNFVSGLILLVERPIKVGDVVAVNGREGQVKRISVRATEIETAKRASIIIPNSEILSSAVTNTTHRGTTSRVDIKVGVIYGSDIEKLRKVLLDCAQADYRVLRHPAPHVLFLNFGDSALEFELRFYVGAPGDGQWVPSDMRFAIDKAFRDQGIEMAFPTHEVRIKDLDRLVEGLAGKAASAPKE